MYQFIFGLSSAYTQKLLFAKPDNVDLDEVITAAVAQEMALASTSLVRSGVTEGSSQVHFAQSTKKFTKSNQNREGGFRQSSNSKSNSNYKKSTSANRSCPNCGSSKHSTAKDCPHKNSKCHNCGKLGHFAKLCRSKSQNVHSTDFVETVDSIHQVSSGKALISISVRINGEPHTMELDTGCQSSILSETFWKRSLGSSRLEKSTKIFRTYTNATFSPRGQLTTQLEYNNQKVEHTFFVTTGNSLFGRDLLRILQIDWPAVHAQCHSVQTDKPQDMLTQLLQEYAVVFDSPKERILNFTAKLILKDDAVPRFLKARPLPFALRERVEKQLNYMEELGQIEKISHSDWASPLCVVPKSNGKLRITGDFKHTINSQLCITQYPLARVEDIFSAVSGGQTFSKLDGSDAYHQIAVDDASKKFLVINTHRGLYRYNVLPQGIASSPAIFQEFMDKMLQGIPMSGSFMDDTLCSGKSEREHLDHLRLILERMKSCNYRLSKSKCQFMLSKLQYLGHSISQRGIGTSPEKLEAIQAMQQPQTVTEVKSFLGLVNFYGKYVPFLSDECESLYSLTRKDTPWKWTSKCDQAFQKVKKCLLSSQVLAHHDQTLPIGIICDASSIGLGVVLFHKYSDNTERPIAFASKTLSKTERNYSQIEKEGLAIIFGIKKFFQFLCGRRFILITDHKPLLAIFGNNSQSPSLAATRLHRWGLYLNAFQFDIVYRKTDDHGNADALSRLPLPESKTETDLIESEVNLLTTSILETLPATAKQVRLHLSRDKDLSKVIYFLHQGWPEQWDKAQPDQLRPYFARRNELTEVQGVLLWGLRVVVPVQLRHRVLKELHSSHSGIVRMKALARQFVWWPNIDSEIETLAKSCSSCAEVKPNPPSAPLHPWAFPERPWQRLHIDLAGPFLGKMWLISVDAHSKWPEIYKLPSDCKSGIVIRFLRETFARFGIPEQIVSDNGSQFTSAEFQSFCASNGIRHSTSSAYHPRSNGEAERFIQTFKRSLKSVEGDMEMYLQKFLLTYRLTPHATTGSSPSELLLNRKPRSLLDLIRPNVNTSVGHAQARQCKTYDHGTKTRIFTVGQTVWVQTHSKNEPKWSQGKITKQVGPVSFFVSAADRIWKRHIDQIREAMDTGHCNPDSTESEPWIMEDEKITQSGSPIGTPVVHTASPPRPVMTHHTPVHSPLTSSSSDSSPEVIAVIPAPVPVRTPRPVRIRKQNSKYKS